VVQRLLDRAAIHDAVVEATPTDPFHLVGNHVAHIDGDTAVAETYAYVGHPWHDGACRLVHRLERRAAGWTVTDRDVVSAVASSGA
jgi:hypothetical protein